MSFFEGLKCPFSKVWIVLLHRFGMSFGGLNCVLFGGVCHFSKVWNVLSAEVPRKAKNQWGASFACKLDTVAGLTGYMNSGCHRNHHGDSRRHHHHHHHHLAFLPQ